MKFSFKLLTAAALAVVMVLPAMADDNVSSVNKSIRIDENSAKGNIDSVNGSIRIGANSSVRSVESVNGSIDLDNNVAVERDVEAVNGSVTLHNGTEVGGNIETVNGRIRLHGTSVAGDVETVNGKISIGDASEVFGDVTVRKSKGWSFNKRNKPVSVEIGENVIVHGNLVFEHAVELKLHETARVGEIIGEKVTIIDG